jgi:hypothetical protein
MSQFINKFSEKVLPRITALTMGFFLIPAIAEARSELAFTTTIMASYSCSDSTYGTTGTYWTLSAAVSRTNYSFRSDYTATCEAGNTSSAAGSVVNGAKTLTAATAQTVSVISSRISTARQESAMRKRHDGISVTALSLNDDASKGHFGLAGGNHSKGIGVWGQGKWTDVDYTATAFAFKGDVTTAMFGIDKSFKNGRFIVGLAAGMEDQSFDTTFNKGTVDGDGFMVAPYMSIRVGKGFSLDATAGIAQLDYDLTRKDSSTNEKFTGSTSGDRMFGALAVNFNKSKKLKKAVVSVGLSAGMNTSEEDKDAYTETGSTGQTVAIASNTAKVTQATVGAEVGLLMMGKIEPFINGKFEWDTSKSSAPTVGASQVQPTVDDEGYRYGGGVNVFLGQKGTATISFEEVAGRDDYEESSVTGRFRLDF